jgi:hypothetical protein
LARHERQKVQIRIASAARNAAVKRLIERHPEEYRALYVEEADRRGVVPKPTTGLVPKRRKIKPLVDEIRASGILDGIDVPEKPPLVPPIPDAPIVTMQRMTRAEQLDAKAAGVPFEPRVIDHTNIPIPPPPWEV